MSMETATAVKSLRRGRIGVHLTPVVKTKLNLLLRRGAGLARTFKKARVLQLLDEGKSIAATAKIAGVCENTVRNVEARYIESGLKWAINDHSRPGAARLLDARGEAKLIAMVCSNPPEGLARWSLAVIAHEVVHRGIADTICTATVYRILHRHALKPWQEKNVVCAKVK